MPLFARQHDAVLARYGELPGRRLVHEVIRRMIHEVVSDLIEETARRLAALAARRHRRRARAAGAAVGFSEAARRASTTR